MDWKKTSCCLCFTNCGLEAAVEGNRIVKVRPDKDNPRSQGYACRKGLNLAHHQHHPDRLESPLKRVGSGFEPISWDQALTEIGDRLKTVLEKHGPASLAYMGGGGQGCRFQGTLGVPFLHALGSRFHYSAAAQEWTGMFWVNGRTLGSQSMKHIPDFERTEMLLSVGWNGMVSHSFPQTPKLIKRLADDPDKLLVVVDPRRSETAALADLHLAIRPGTDALLFKAMIAVILQEGWEDKEYLAGHVSGLETIKTWALDFDPERALAVCELSYDQVREVCQWFTSRRSSLHLDLGVLMNRHSTVASYLETVLLAVSGRFGVAGGNVLPGHLSPLVGHTDERDPATWRTKATDIPAIGTVFPPNVMPEEILSDHPQRLRAVIVGAANPLRSYADTGAYEKAFQDLELLVTIDLALTETAERSDFVLPARSALESWDGSLFAWNFPGIFFQMRRPVVEPRGEPLEGAEIFFRLAETMGLVPDLPPDLIKAAAQGPGPDFVHALAAFTEAEPRAAKARPFIVARALGPALGSIHLAMLWDLLQVRAKHLAPEAIRAGFEPGPDLGQRLFQAVVDQPQGLWIGEVDPDRNLEKLTTEDGRINLKVPELDQWLAGIEPDSEEEALKPDPAYPLILSAGRHYQFNANTLMRDPAWNKGRRAGTVALSKADAQALGLEDGQTVRVTTEAGSVTGELEVDRAVRPGTVIIPHGFGLKHQGRTIGPNVNQLTKSDHRDPLAATPLHRYVPCWVEGA